MKILESFELRNLGNDLYAVLAVLKQFGKLVLNER